MKHLKQLSGDVRRVRTCFRYLPFSHKSIEVIRSFQYNAALATTRAINGTSKEKISGIRP